MAPRARWWLDGSGPCKGTVLCHRSLTRSSNVTFPSTKDKKWFQAGCYYQYLHFFMNILVSISFVYFLYLQIWLHRTRSTPRWGVVRKDRLQSAICQRPSLPPEISGRMYADSCYSWDRWRGYKPKKYFERKKGKMQVDFSSHCSLTLHYPHSLILLSHQLANKYYE